MFPNTAQHTDVLHHNRKVLMDTLRRLAITEVVITYNGCGDSGCIAQIQVMPTDGMPSALEESLSFQQITTNFQDENYTATIQEEKLTLGCALEDFVMSWVDIHHAGWENNEGGEGTMTIKVVEDSFTLEHRNFYTECSHHDYAL